MTMRDCSDGATRDLLPLYTSGTMSGADQRMVESHIAGCADCAAEVELLRAVSRAYAPMAVNVATIVAKIPQRGRVRVSAAPFHRQPLWRVAASLTLFIAGTAAVVVVRGRTSEGILAPTAQVAPTSTRGATSPVETTIVATGPGVVRTTSSGILSLGAEMSDLTDAQLQSLLGSLDGLDSRPQADPTTIATPIIPVRTQAPGRSNQ